ncbi:MAG: phage tail assembly chaperone [Methyloceanibacter sp.]|nr:phage tail assembly chaperone [Methyloceanibacter sp.]
MEAGLGTLRLAPHIFWAMTPRELDAVLRDAWPTPTIGSRAGS